ncbi:membrane protein [Mycobacterium phage STLscum]|nr:membrane protein [Mycobacterium phage STLscum]
MSWLAVAAFWLILTGLGTLFSIAVVIAGVGEDLAWFWSGIAGTAVLGTAASLLCGVVF